MMNGRAVWNIVGALALSLVTLVGVYWLVKALDPLMRGDWGLVGGAIVVFTLIGLFVVLFVVLLKIVPVWVAAGEKRFPN